MEKVIQELQQLIDDYSKKISALPENSLSDKPLPHKWSKKEVLGHLIDSGQTNLRRFVCGQYESEPTKIVYEQDFWVAANGYQNAKSADIITLWKLVNERICAVLQNMPTANYGKKVDSNKNETQLRALDWLAADYVKHIKHHLNQIIPGSFNIVYP